MQYKLNTDGIEVSVRVEYINSQINKDGNFFVWSYHIEIINKSNDTVQLVNRHWKIIDEVGVLQEVKGLGAVGEQPILATNDNFKYTSNVHLHHPSGVMGGSYGMKKSNGEIVQIKIPTFSLDVPDIKSTIN